MEATMTIERMAIELVKINELGEVVLNKKQREMVSDEIEDIRKSNDGKFERSIEVEDGIYLEMSGWCENNQIYRPRTWWDPEEYTDNYEGEIEEMYVLIYDEDTNDFKRYDVTLDFFNECNKELLENF